MNIKKLLVDSVNVFAVSLIVSVIVTLLWNLIFHGANTNRLGDIVPFRHRFRHHLPMDRNTRR